MAIINGTPNPDNLQGTPTDDVMDGFAGNDSLFANAGNDRLLGGAGTDLLSGEDGDDIAFGGLDSDSVAGGLGNDRLYGESGPDRIFGDAGDDLLNGGQDADIFLFNPLEDRDTIQGFQQGQDQISLNGFSQIQDFAGVPQTVVGGNTVMDLSASQGLPDGAQVITVLGVAGLNPTDFNFSTGPIILAEVVTPDEMGIPIATTIPDESLAP